MRDWRSTPLEWLSSTHDLNLDLAIFGTSEALWPWIRSYGIPSCTSHRPLSRYQISLKSDKLFLDGRTYWWTLQTPSNVIRSTWSSRPKTELKFTVHFTTGVAYPTICISMRKVIVHLVFNASDAVTGWRSSASQTSRTAAFAFICPTIAATVSTNIVIWWALGNTAAVLLKVNTWSTERQSLTVARTTLGMAPDASLSHTQSHRTWLSALIALLTTFCISRVHRSRSHGVQGSGPHKSLVVNLLWLGHHKNFTKRNLISAKSIKGAAS